MMSYQISFFAMAIFVGLLWLKLGRLASRVWIDAEEAMDRHEELWRFRKAVEEDFHTHAEKIKSIKAVITGMEKQYKAFSDHADEFLRVAYERDAEYAKMKGKAEDIERSRKNDFEAIGRWVNDIDDKIRDFQSELARGHHDQIKINHCALSDMARVFTMLANEYKPGNAHLFGARSATGMDKLASIKQELKGK